MKRAQDSSAAKQQRKDAIILGALKHVPFDGWGVKSLRHGAEEAGLKPADMDVLFPDGATQAVAHFVDLADRVMISEFAKQDISKLKHRDKIALIVRLRLEHWTAHREAIRRAIALSPLPSVAGSAMRGWYGTVDAMWKAIGDKSVDFSFYTKRALLAAVYGSTLLYWLDDKSENCNATWAFLARRIDDVMRIPKLRSKVMARLERLPTPLRLFERLTAFGASRRTT